MRCTAVHLAQNQTHQRHRQCRSLELCLECQDTPPVHHDTASCMSTQWLKEQDRQSIRFPHTAIENQKTTLFLVLLGTLYIKKCNNFPTEQGHKINEVSKLSLPTSHEEIWVCPNLTTDTQSAGIIICTCIYSIVPRQHTVCTCVKLDGGLLCV